ncbi:MAG: SMC-Scp complex subunit ScpB [Planctomycetaceae bacterium]
MFEQIRKLWDRPDDGPRTPEPSLPAIDLSQLQAAGPPNPETAQLDALVRQAFEAMEAVETGCESVSQELNDVPSDDDAADLESAQPADEPGPRNAVAAAVTPQQVLEAALFVGGTDLTLKRLCTLLGNEFSSDKVEAIVEQLNQRYMAEGRPYDVQFGKGGYRMALKPEFDDVCNRVFGLGPKEVKLSKDALEVLSLVAYRQPIGGDEMAELRGNAPTAILRQLLRRELIALQRADDDPKQVRYHTTPRFLQAFGLATLDDLPQADDLAFK